MTQVDTNSTESQGSTPEQEDRAIQVLMEEYKTLRAEILQRISSNGQIPGFLVAGTAIVVSVLSISGHGLFRSLGLYISLTVLIGGYTYWRHNKIVYHRIGDHVASLEQEINQRAERAYGSNVGLLTWETYQKQVRADTARSPLAKWRYRLLGWR